MNKLRNLRLLTYNVYFDSSYLPQRMEAIGRTIERYRPAVIALQEVTNDIWGLLSKQNWFQYYDNSLSFHSPENETYFSVLLSALPVFSVQALPFENSVMDRELVVMEVEVNPNEVLLVGTTHLESLPRYKESRRKQWKDCLQFMENAVHDSREGEIVQKQCLGCVLMGDMNFLQDDTVEEGAPWEKNQDGTRTKSQPQKYVSISLAASSRSKCTICKEKIPMNDPRIGEKATIKKGERKEITVETWKHMACFYQDQSKNNERYIPPSKMFGIHLLEPKVQQRIQEMYAIATGKDHETIPIEPSFYPKKDFSNYLGKWIDCWLAHYPEDAGMTFDGRRNKMCYKNHISRFDRIMYYDTATKATKKTCTLKEIQMVGTEPLMESEEIPHRAVWPSDHFGLQCSLSIEGNDNDNENEII